MAKKELEQYLEESFDSFCKTVIRNEAINAHTELNIRAEHETSLSDLTNSSLHQLSTEDSYKLDSTHFLVRGTDVYVCDPDLSKALQLLSPQRREVILLSFFLDLSDVEISRVLRIDADSVGYRRKVALKRLHELLEENGDA